MSPSTHRRTVVFSPELRNAFRLAGEAVARIVAGLPNEPLDVAQSEGHGGAAEPTGDRALVVVAGIVAELVAVGKRDTDLSDEVAMRAYTAVPWVRPERLAGIAVVAREIVRGAWPSIEALAAELLRARRLDVVDVLRVVDAAKRGRS